jgi:histidinol-phosphate aminotransferase
MSLTINQNIATAPIYVGGASIESIQKAYGVSDVVKIASNENPFGPSPLAVAAIQEAVAGLNRYPPMGDDDLRAALAEAIGQGMTPDNFMTGNGASDVLARIATAFLDPGDECIICRPTFPVYESSARRRGAGVVYADLEPEHYSYDVEAILEAVTGRTRLIYVCSPNNPTGGIITAEQMETLVNNAPDHLLIVTDEVYHHFVTQPDYPNSLAYVWAGKNVIITHSFSKAFGLAGLRLGYAIAPPEIARYLARTREPFHLNQLAMVGGAAGLKDNEHIAQTVTRTLAGRDWLYNQLCRRNLPVWPSQANFLLFKPPYPPSEISERLLSRGIILRPMAQFYLPDHLRVTVGLPAENERFIAALDEVLYEIEREGISKEVAVDDNDGVFKF